MLGRKRFLLFTFHEIVLELLTPNEEAESPVEPLCACDGPTGRPWVNSFSRSRTMLRLSDEYASDEGMERGSGASGECSSGRVSLLCQKESSEYEGWLADLLIDTSDIFLDDEEESEFDDVFR